MFFYKPDFEQTFKRFEAWWHGEIIDRAPVSITFPKPPTDQKSVPEKQHATLRDRWLDTEFVVDSEEATIHNTVYFADSLPVAWPNLGPEVFSAFYGCELEFGEDTTWSKPILNDWSQDLLKEFVFSTENFYFKKLVEITDALLEAGKDKFIVGYTDLHGGGDAIAAFRDPQNLLLDIIQFPDEIKALCDRITADFLGVYDFFYEKLSQAGMPSTTWLPLTGKGKFHIPSNDFSCMISDHDFERLFIPGIIDECKHMDRCIYHLDGPQALRYLDRLLEIPEIQAIQWVPGAGRDYWADWIETYQRIQEKGKSMQILSIPANDLPILFESLHPQGVWISQVTGISISDEAKAVVDQISNWTKKQES